MDGTTKSSELTPEQIKEYTAMWSIEGAKNIIRNELLNSSNLTQNQACFDELPNKIETTAQKLTGSCKNFNTWWTTGYLKTKLKGIMKAANLDPTAVENFVENLPNEISSTSSSSSTPSSSTNTGTSSLFNFSKYAKMLTAGTDVNDVRNAMADNGITINDIAKFASDALSSDEYNEYIKRGEKLNRADLEKIIKYTPLANIQSKIKSTLKDKIDAVTYKKLITLGVPENQIISKMRIAGMSDQEIDNMKNGVTPAHPSPVTTPTPSPSPIPVNTPRPAPTKMTDEDFTKLIDKIITEAYDLIKSGKSPVIPTVPSGTEPGLGTPSVPITPGSLSILVPDSSTRPLHGTSSFVPVFNSDGSESTPSIKTVLNTYFEYSTIHLNNGTTTYTVFPIKEKSQFSVNDVQYSFAKPEKPGPPKPVSPETGPTKPVSPETGQPKTGPLETGPPETGSPETGPLETDKQESVGIINKTGSICWLNSTIQLLYHIHEIRDCVLNYKEDPSSPAIIISNLQMIFNMLSGNNSEPDKPIINIVGELDEHDNYTGSYDNIFNALHTALPGSFEGRSQQQDASEALPIFIAAFINSFEGGCLNVANSFNFTTRVEYLCDDVQLKDNPPTNNDTILQLYGVPEKGTTIKDLIKINEKAETISAYETNTAGQEVIKKAFEATACEKEIALSNKANLGTATRRNVITDTGKYLLIKINRFTHDEKSVPKRNDGNVEINRQLNIAGKPYVRYGIICHHGETIQSGHYTFYSFDDNGNFVTLYDDDNVTKPYVEEDVEKLAYIVLYKEDEIVSVSPGTGNPSRSRSSSTSSIISVDAAPTAPTAPTATPTAAAPTAITNKPLIGSIFGKKSKNPKKTVVETLIGNKSTPTESAAAPTESAAAPIDTTTNPTTVKSPKNNTLSNTNALDIANKLREFDASTPEKKIEYFGNQSDSIKNDILNNMGNNGAKAFLESMTSSERANYITGRTDAQTKVDEKYKKVATEIENKISAAASITNKFIDDNMDKEIAKIANKRFEGFKESTTEEKQKFLKSNKEDLNEKIDFLNRISVTGASTDILRTVPPAILANILDNSKTNENTKTMIKNYITDADKAEIRKNNTQGGTKRGTRRRHKS